MMYCKLLLIINKTSTYTILKGFLDELYLALISRNLKNVLKKATVVLIKIHFSYTC